MNRTALIGVAVLVVLVAGVGAALYTGAGPAPGGDSGEDIEDFPTEEPSDDGTADDGDETTADSEPFVFGVDEVEDCGQTCRDVTATLFNEQDETAANVTTYIRIYAGEDNTDPDDVVWEGTVDVGELEAGDSHTSTERVELSLQDARKVDQEDGWITIQTTVDSDDERVTFVDSEQVA